MNKYFLFSFCLFISVSLSAGTVYKNINPDGSVTFTDQPSTDSKKIKIRKPTTYTPMRLPSVNSPSKKLSTKTNYSITIVSPAANETLLNRRDILVSISLQPELRSNEGHQFQYQLDGQSMVSQSMSVIFTNVSRGTHSISVSVIDKTEQVISSTSSTFHLKRFFKKPAKPRVR